MNLVVTVKKLIQIQLCVLLCWAPQVTAEKSSQPIKIILNDWTSQLVLSHITAELFELQGYQTEFVNKTTNSQWGSLQRGITHVQVEVWEGTMEKMFNRMVKKGGIVDAGDHNVSTREDWWYPLYVEDMCPGLPDWRALKKCSALFASEKTAPKGRYLGGPWEKPDAARIRALGLDFQVVSVSNGDDLWPELDKAVAKKQAIVMFNWTPNWVEAKYAGRFIEFPEHHPECESNPKWGINPKFLHDCGNPKGGWLKKAAWKGMQQQWPCAFNTLTNISFTNSGIAQLAYMVDGEGLTVKQAAKRWLSENSQQWQSWLPSQCNK